MLIDTHTHIFPEAIAARAVASLQEGMLRANGLDHPPVSGATLPDLKAEMARAGVTLSVVAPIATKPSQTPSINRFAREITDGTQILSLGSLHPLQPDWETVLEELAEQGFAGIKLHPEFQEFFIDSPESIRILKKAESLGLIVLLHAGADMGYLPPYHCTPQRLYHALQHLDGGRIIAAHMGGYLMWEEVARYLLGSPLFLDTAAVCRDMDAKTAVDLIRGHGSDRILFASDFPWFSQQESRVWLEALPLTLEERAQIAWQNFSRLAGLD